MADIFTPESRFLTIEKFDRRMRELENFRFVEMENLLPMEGMDDDAPSGAVHTEIPDVIEGHTLHEGDILPGVDRYWWLRTTVTIPEAKPGLIPAGYFDFGQTGGGNNLGFESLLYVNRRPYQGVDSNHKEVLFADLAGQTVELTFLLWSGLQGGDPNYILIHRVSAAKLGYLHQETDDYYYSAKALVKTLRLLPDDHPQRAGLVSAMDRSLKFLNWDDDKFHGTVSEAARSLENDLAAMEKHSDVTIRCVGHTHIDVAWLWRLNHTREKAMRSFSTVLHLMEEFEEYDFLQTQPQLYRYIKKDCPELFEKIKAKVADGQWETDGGMWLEADCNIVSGESLTRQFLYGIRFFQKEFGKTCSYLWLPDVFGYSWALPQILKQCNIDTFMTTKISWNQFNTMPDDLFRWKGMDGTEVLTYFVTTPEMGMSLDNRYSTYNGMLSPRSVLGTWKKFRNKDLSNEVLISYGFGDGGGGVNRNMLKMRRAMDKMPGLPNVKTTRAGDFFRDLHKKVDETDRYVHTWDGELYLEYHRGTYTNQARNKKWNRSTENHLARTEWLSAMSWLMGGEYADEAIHEAWETLLRNQFHDIIPGSSIQEVYEDSWKEYEEANRLLDKADQDAWNNLIQNSENQWTLYHFGSFPRTETVFLPETRKGRFMADGSVLPVQAGKDGCWVQIALEPLTPCVITFVPETVEEAPAVFTADTEARTLETPYYTICWNENGVLTRIWDKENSREVLSGEGNRLEVFEDKPINFDAWDIDVYYTQKQETPVLVQPVEVTDCGALKATLRFVYRYNASEIAQDMTVYADSRRIDFATRVDWHEKRRLLKTAFQVDIRTTRATYDIQYGHVERPTHMNNSWDWAKFEVVGHKWADISENGYGVSLLNDCKYGYSIRENVMKLSLLKSSKYPDQQSDMGVHTFTYALLPHAGSVTEGNTIEESVVLNLPAQVVPGAAVNGLRPVVLTDRRLVLDAVKKSEDGDDLIVRLHECRGGRMTVKLSSDLPLASISACNLLEEETGETWTPDNWEVSWKPFEIKTFRLKRK